MQNPACATVSGGFDGPNCESECIEKELSTL